MATVLVLSLVFRPDNVSTAHLVADLSVDLAAAGHVVTVVTTTPHYNPDATAAAQQPIHRWFGGLVGKSSIAGIPVYHVWMPPKGTNKLYRIITWVWFHIVSTILSLFAGKRPDVVLVPSPPLTIGLSAWLVAALRRGKLIYNVQEIYPDVAINLGIIRNPALIGVLRRMEAFIYARSFAVTVISRRMQENLLRKGVSPEKARLVPNFVDMADFSPGEKVNAFSQAHRLTDQFVVSYAGNMGKPQHLDLLIDAAALLCDRRDIKIVMMGNGSEYRRLEDKSRGMKNVVFISQQPYAMMPLAYATMDVCYVPQAPGTATDGVPSKVYRILSAARPVLAYTDADSDVAELIRDARAGTVVSNNDPAALASAIAQMADNRSSSAAMGRAGREYVEQRYERRVVSSTYSRLITEAAGAGAKVAAASTQ